MNNPDGKSIQWDSVGELAIFLLFAWPLILPPYIAERFGNPFRHKHGVLIPIVTVALDRIVTIPYWGYESNAIVQELGILNWIALSVSILAVYALVWYRMEMWDSSIVYFLNVLITSPHLLAVISNLAVIVSS